MIPFLRRAASSLRLKSTESLPLTALAAMLIVVGYGMINVPRIQTVWNTGPAPLTVMIITFKEKRVISFS